MKKVIVLIVMLLGMTILGGCSGDLKRDFYTPIEAFKAYPYLEEKYGEKFIFVETTGFGMGWYRFAPADDPDNVFEVYCGKYGEMEDYYEQD